MEVGEGRMVPVGRLVVGAPVGDSGADTDTVGVREGESEATTEGLTTAERKALGVTETVAVERDELEPALTEGVLMDWELREELVGDSNPLLL
jgi:hypothetical protein